jgi:ADP-ribose pyrophosphatase YjhB (NUDIX family)
MIAYCPSCGSNTQTRLVAKQSLSACAQCDRIFFRNPKVVVTALIEEAGRVLLVLRDIEPGRGLWGMPGGYVDWNEHPQDALIRECMEEVRARVEPMDLLAVQHIVMGEEGIVILPYRARLVAGHPSVGEEVQQVGWFAPDQLPPLAFATHRKVLQGWTHEVLARGAA